MSITDELARSFFDLWHHLDPVAAARFDPEGPPLALRPVDRRGLRDHVTALRSLGGAAEALEPATLDEEIDQTMLLGAIRTVEHEASRERARRRDPAFWTGRLVETLERRRGDPDLIAALPPWAESVRGFLGRPPVFGVETALAFLEIAQELLHAESWGDSGAERLPEARAAIGGLASELRDAPAGAEPDAIGIGERAVDWHLHHAYLLELSGRDSLRALAVLTAAWDPLRDAPARPSSPDAGAAVSAMPRYRSLTDPDLYVGAGVAGALAPSRLEVTAGHPARDRAIIVARYGPLGAGGLIAARGQAKSEIRRRHALAAAVEGWALFAEARAHERATGAEQAMLAADLHRQIVLAATDLAVHRRQVDPAEAADRLAERFGEPRAIALARVRGLLLRPLERAAAALLWREWEALGPRWPGGPEAMIEAVLASGLPLPALARWRHHVDG